MTSEVAFTNHLHSTVVLIGCPESFVTALCATTGAESVCTEMTAGTAPAGKENGWKEGKQARKGEDEEDREEGERVSQPISWLCRCECSPKGLTFGMSIWWPLAPEFSLVEKQGWQSSAH